MVTDYRKTLHLRAARPQDLRFDSWLDFLAVAAERASAVWRDLTETCWPTWKEQGERAAEPLLRQWAECWNLTTPEGEPHPQALDCARENLRLRKWREENGQPQPRPDCLIPITGYSDLRRGDEVQMQMLPVPRILQRVRFEAAWACWRTGESIAAARDRLIREFTAVLNEHIERYLAHVNHAQYAEEAERRRWRQHLEWFCDFQLNGRAVPALLANAPDTDERTMRKALRGVADALGLRLRQDRRGRKALK